jgi:hypothetical protein
MCYFLVVTLYIYTNVVETREASKLFLYLILYYENKSHLKGSLTLSILLKHLVVKLTWFNHQQLALTVRLIYRSRLELGHLQNRSVDGIETVHTDPNEAVDGGRTEGNVQGHPQLRVNND